MQPLVKQPPSIKRKLIKLPEFASHIYWNLTSTELACLQPLPPAEKNQRRKGDFLLDIITLD